MGARGNTLPYDEALRVAECHSAFVVGMLNELSVRLYSGELLCEMAAGEGLGHREMLCEKAGENTTVNRVRGGPCGMGVALVCRDVVSGRSLVVHPRVRSSIDELNNSTLTTQSNKDSKYGLLYEHWAMPVVMDGHRIPVLYGMYSIRELEGWGLLRLFDENGDTRKTFVRAKLGRVPLGSWRGKRCGFGFGHSRVYGVDVVACILRILRNEEVE